jgi:hypothetical protein
MLLSHVPPIPNILTKLKNIKQITLESWLYWFEGYPLGLFWTFGKKLFITNQDDRHEIIVRILY